MPKYSLSEVSEISGVAENTLNYFIENGVFSEGENGLYSDEDLNKLKVVCFFHESKMKMKDIKKLLKDGDYDSLIFAIKKKQENEIFKEIFEEKLCNRDITELKSIVGDENVKIEADSDRCRKPRRVYNVTLALGIIMDVLELGLLIYWSESGNYLPFLIGLGVILLTILFVAGYFYKTLSYVCPKCKRVFKPKFWEFFFVSHNNFARKLTCTHCGFHGFCLETLEKTENK